MALDRRIRESLERTARSSGVPHGFSDDVMSLLPGPRPHGARLRRAGVYVAAVAALALVVAVIAVPRALPSTGSSSSATSAAPERFQAPGISFDLPKSWVISPNDLPLHYEHVLAYIGTGAGSMKCGSDFLPGLGGTCTETVTLAPNTIVVRISEWNGPLRADTPVNSVMAANPKASPATVSGLPAAVQDLSKPPYGADRAIEWTLSRPGVEYGSFVLTAYVRGPDDASLVADFAALISSVQLSDVTATS
jgi:hypothetical protein